MSGSRIHSMQVTTNKRNYEGSDQGDDEFFCREERQDAFSGSNGGTAPRAASCIQDTRQQPIQGATLEDEELGYPGLRVHAPWPGLHGACGGCGAPSVSRLGSDPHTCEHCHRRLAQVPKRDKLGGVGGALSKSSVKEVAVTSAREIALGAAHVRTLMWTGTVVLGSSLLLLVLLLVVWRGVNLSLVSSLSPWLGVYLPVPLGILNGAWSLHCARKGHILHEGTGSCVARAGLCGTAWGCSGPSCALNLGLDLGVFITALLATLPAGASATGCGYDCYALLCFPCAPGGGEGMASAMVLSSLGLAFGVGGKMWAMTSAIRKGGFGGGDFLPW